MPLLDHFHPPVKRRLGWTSLHSGWATYLATNLGSRWLPPPFLAVENTQRNMAIEVDVGTFSLPGDAPNPGGIATQSRTWTAAPPRDSVAIEFGDAYEVLIYADEDGWKLVAAIELVSEKNKDRPSRRDAFIGKCAGLLERGVSVAIMDIVTCRLANLHNQLLELLDIRGPSRLANDCSIYTSAYHPVERDGRTELDIWAEPLQIGQELPTMPLRVGSELVVPLEWEETYTEICRLRRVI